jgi:hypothetical protein
MAEIIMDKPIRPKERNKNLYWTLHRIFPNVMLHFSSAPLPGSERADASRDHGSVRKAVGSLRR